MRHSGGTRQNYDRRKEAKSCSLFRILVVVLVSSWTAFVFFCLKYGYFSTSPYVDSIKNVTGALRGNIENMKFHIPRISYTESKSIAPSITTDESNIHVIFSTDCGSYQDWQTLVMFHSAKAVGQKGHITRIASGCNAEQKEILIKLYEKLYPQNHVHFTPDFKKDEKSKKSCKDTFLMASTLLLIKSPFLFHHLSFFFTSSSHLLEHMTVEFLHHFMATYLITFAPNLQL